MKIYLNLLLIAFSSFTFAENAVETYQLEHQDSVAEIQYIGHVESKDLVLASTDVAGRISYLAELGSHVHKGDVVAQLDDPKLHYELAQLEAQQSQEALNLKHIEKKRSANSMLSKEAYSSEVETDRLNTEKLVSEQKLRNIRAQINQLQQKITNLRVIAVADAVVTERLHHIGEFIEENIAILALNSLNTDITTTITSSHAMTLNVGEPINVSVGQQKITAVIEKIYPVNGSNNQLFKVHLQPNSPLALGQLIHVGIPKVYSVPTMLVHEDALRIQEDGYSVVKVDESKLTAQVVPVKLLDHHKNWVVVAGNLKQGDTLVTKGNMNLKTGDAVKVLNNKTNSL